MSEAMWQLKRAKGWLDSALAALEENDEDIDVEIDKWVEKQGQRRKGNRYFKVQSPLRRDNLDAIFTSVQQRRALIRLVNREIVAMSKQEDGDG